MQRPPRSMPFVVPFLAVAALAGCGGGDGDGRDVASLGAASADDATDPTGTTGSTDPAGTTDVSGTAGGGKSRDGNSGGPGGMVVMRSAGAADDPAMQDAQVRYSRCMREHGVDMPDPSSDDAAVQVEIDDPEDWQAGEEACRPILEEIVGTFEPPSEEELARMREEMLEFARCMREHGVDMPDPQFGDDGSVTVGAPGEGGRLDGPDEEFRAAAEECGGPGGGVVFSAPEPAGAEGD